MASSHVYMVMWRLAVILQSILPLWKKKRVSGNLACKMLIIKLEKVCLQGKAHLNAMYTCELWTQLCDEQKKKNQKNPTWDYDQFHGGLGRRRKNKTKHFTMVWKNHSGPWSQSQKLSQVISQGASTMYWGTKIQSMSQILKLCKSTPLPQNQLPCSNATSPTSLQDIFQQLFLW